MIKEEYEKEIKRLNESLEKMRNWIDYKVCPFCGKIIKQ